MPTYTDENLELRCLVPNLTNAQIWDSLQVQKGGTGYTSAPSVSISSPGGSGTQATAHTELTRAVTWIAVTNGGSGYTQATVSFSGTGGAQATAIIRGGQITAIRVTNGGDYSSPPTVSIAGDGTGASAQATMSVNKIVIDNAGSGYASDPTLTIDVPNVINGIRAIGYGKRKPDSSVYAVLAGDIPYGSSIFTLIDYGTGSTGNFANMFLIVNTEDNTPLLTTNQGFIVEKDFQAGGFLASLQGALWLNHGLVGRPELSSPPCIELMSSGILYKYGTSFPADPENGQIFYLTQSYYWDGQTRDSGYYMWDGTANTWQLKGKADAPQAGPLTGNYDTLFLFKSNGISPANMHLGNLYAASTVTAGGNRLGGAGETVASVGANSGYSFEDRSGFDSYGRWVLYANAGAARLWSSVRGSDVVSINSLGDLTTSGSLTISGGSLTIGSGSSRSTLNAGYTTLNGQTVSFIGPSVAPTLKDESYWVGGVGLGTSSYFWNFVDSAYYYAKYTSFMSFDSLDDLALIKNSKIKQIGSNSIIDMDSLPHLKADDYEENGRVDVIKTSSFMLGALKQAANKFDDIDANFENLRTQNTKLTEEITELRSLLEELNEKTR